MAYPYAVSWQITERCNLRCSHCHDVSERQPSLEQCRSLIDELAEAQVFVLSLTGGEPFARTDLVELVGHAHRHHMMTVIATNGLLLETEQLRTLRRLGTTAVAVSLDGATAPVHESLRGPGTFAGALRGLEMIREAGLHPILSTAVDETNVHQLDEIFHLAVQTGCERVKVQVIIRPGFTEEGAFAHQLGLGPHQLMEVLCRSREVAERVGNPEFVRFCCYTNYLRGLLQPGAPLAGCPAGRSKVTIQANGEVILCEFTPDSVIGNAFERPFREIWRSADGARASWLGDRTYGGACGTCSHQSSCRGGCLVLSRQRQAGVWDDPYCLVGNGFAS